VAQIADTPRLARAVPTSRSQLIEAAAQIDSYHLVSWKLFYDTEPNLRLESFTNCNDPSLIGSVRPRRESPKTNPIRRAILHQILEYCAEVIIITLSL
jgi:hypothetical protein